MKIIYAKRKNKSIKERLFISIEILMLTFVVSVLGIFLMVQKAKVQQIEQGDIVETIMDNVIFDAIELEYRKTNNYVQEKAEEYIKSKGEVSVFKMLFEEKQNG